jgi:uncharacterized membrane protein YqaE (UPF0057 family)
MTWMTWAMNSKNLQLKYNRTKNNTSMKKILASFILLAVAGSLFTSCSNLSKISIAKRHYRSGFYVNWGGRSLPNLTQPVSRNPIREKHPISPIVIAKSEKNPVLMAPAIKSKKQGLTKKIITQKSRQENYPVNIELSSASQNTLAQNTRVNDYIAVSSGDGNHDRNVSVPFVIIVLCAIFIPPLGVGLMYGIDSYFWIDLILTLLFFFPGMIFALIVVLM